MNIHSNEDINDSLRVIINFYAKDWDNQTLKSLIDSKTLREFQENRTHLLQAQYKTIYNKLHIVQVTNCGDLQTAIDNSQFDYEVEGRILEGKKKAAKKIALWWKKKRN